MTRKLTLFVVAFAFVIFSAGMAAADTWTVPDSVIAWPGWENPLYPDDVIYAPSIESMTIKVDDYGYLDEVTLQFNPGGRVLWDSLFINTELGGPLGYQSWDYYVKQNWGSNWTPNGLVPVPPVMYQVPASYTYAYATEGRIGHPSGFENLDTFTQISNWGTAIYDEGTARLIYDFMTPIYVGTERQFVIGYAPWCANDVIITTPEPGSLLLLGIGLIGVGVVARRRFSK